MTSPVSSFEPVGPPERGTSGEDDAGVGRFMDCSRSTRGQCAAGRNRARPHRLRGWLGLRPCRSSSLTAAAERNHGRGASAIHTCARRSPAPSRVPRPRYTARAHLRPSWATTRSRSPGHPRGELSLAAATRSVPWSTRSSNGRHRPTGVRVPAARRGRPELRSDRITALADPPRKLMIATRRCASTRRRGGRDTPPSA